MKFTRRLPQDSWAQTVALSGCPDFFEIVSGDFAGIGIEITDRASEKLPLAVSCGSEERIATVPRKTTVIRLVAKIGNR